VHPLTESMGLRGRNPGGFTDGEAVVEVGPAVAKEGQHFATMYDGLDINPFDEGALVVAGNPQRCPIGAVHPTQPVVSLVPLGPPPGWRR